MPAGGFVVGDGQKAYPGKLTPFVLFTCVVAAMGGLIFGYDIGISGKYLTIFRFYISTPKVIYVVINTPQFRNYDCLFDTKTLDRPPHTFT